MSTDNIAINEIIWQTVAAIPKGSVVTYGDIAKLAGYPNHARYIGTTLKDLPSESRLPWHRIVNAKGELSFAKESEHYQKQRALLESEGITFKSLKLPLKTYRLHNSEHLLTPSKR